MTRLFSEVQSASYARKVEEIASDLELLAEEVRRAGRPKETRDGLDYVNAAHNVLHAAIWKFANLNLDDLVTRARDVEIALQYEKDHPVDE
jgi:hypothetical protein